MRAQLIAIALTGALAACSAGASGSAQTLADNATKAAYSNDMAGLAGNFNDSLARQVTRAEVGTISDQMHRLGDYKGLTMLSSDATKSEFTYRADFTSGSMNVVVRVDPNGKLAAYRVFPNSK
jgi:hypothetical protein